MLRGERVAGAPTRGRLLFSIRYTLASLWTEVLVGSRELAAIGLIALNLAIQAIIFVTPGHFRPAPVPAFSALIALGTLVGLAAVFAAPMMLHVQVPVRVRQALCLFALASLLPLAGVGAYYAVDSTTNVLNGAGYSNDGAVMDLYAANQVLAGHNPYQTANIVHALANMNAPSQTTTPLMRGAFGVGWAYPMPPAIDRVFMNDLRLRPGVVPSEFESQYNYPSGSFLLILPLVWAGLNDMRLLYVLAVVLMGAYLMWRLPRALRLLAPLLLLGNLPLVIMTGGGQPDPVYGVFLLVAFAEWPTRHVSPLAMGVAVATKQLAWFFFPFYLVLIWRKFGTRETLRRAGLAAAIFGMFNLPFILQSPDHYFAGVTAPMVDPMFPLGIGLIAVFVANLAPMISKAAFTALELGAWAVSVAAVTRSRKAVAASALIALGALPLFFAWRSLTSYFYLVPLLGVAVLFADQRRALSTGKRAPA